MRYKKSFGGDSSKRLVIKKKSPNRYAISSSSSKEKKVSSSKPVQRNSEYLSPQNIYQTTHGKRDQTTNEERKNDGGSRRFRKSIREPLKDVTNNNSFHERDSIVDSNRKSKDESISRSKHSSRSHPINVDSVTPRIDNTSSKQLHDVNKSNSPGSQHESASQYSKAIETNNEESNKYLNGITKERSKMNSSAMDETSDISLDIHSCNEEYDVQVVAYEERLMKDRLIEEDCNKDSDGLPEKSIMRHKTKYDSFNESEIYFDESGRPRITKNLMERVRNSDVDNEYLLQAMLRSGEHSNAKTTLKDYDYSDARNTSFQSNTVHSKSPVIGSVINCDLLVKRPSIDDSEVTTNSHNEENLEEEEPNVLSGHPVLPSGWVIRMSKSKNRPYYVHPDFGSTWHCPVVLQSRSKISNSRRYEKNQRSSGIIHHPSYQEYENLDTHVLRNSDRVVLHDKLLRQYIIPKSSARKNRIEEVRILATLDEDVSFCKNRNMAYLRKSDPILHVPKGDHTETSQDLDVRNQTLYEHEEAELPIKSNNNSSNYKKKAEEVISNQIKSFSSIAPRNAGLLFKSNDQETLLQIELDHIKKEDDFQRNSFSDVDDNEHESNILHNDDSIRDDENHSSFNLTDESNQDECSYTTYQPNCDNSHTRIESVSENLVEEDDYDETIIHYQKNTSKREFNVLSITNQSASLKDEGDNDIESCSILTDGVEKRCQKDENIDGNYDDDEVISYPLSPSYKTCNIDIDDDQDTTDISTVKLNLDEKLIGTTYDTTCNETSDKTSEGDFSNNYDSYQTDGFTDTDDEVERNDDYQMKIKGISDRVLNPPNPICSLQNLHKLKKISNKKHYHKKNVGSIISQLKVKRKKRIKLV